MIKVRIGNDIPLAWSFYAIEEGERVPYILEGKDIRIEMSDCSCNKVVVPVTISGNTASWTFLGKAQTNIGPYSFTFYENKGKNGMKALDKVHPFTLVPRQEVMETGAIEGSVSTFEVRTIAIESNMTEIISYESLVNLPKINHVVLLGDKTLEELGIASAEDLAQENARARSEEQALASAIGAEAQRAQGAEQTLQGAINTESERAQQVEQGLQGAIQSESQRAQQVEGELSRDLAAETRRATQAETALSNDITKESDRAKEAEGNLSEAVTEESERAQGAENNLSTAIGAEVTRAQQAEGNLSTAISNEETRAKGNESELAGAISQEATRAQGAEAANTNAINAESQRAQGAESSLSAAIGAEETRAKTKETELGTAIANETSRAQGAEGNLSTAIQTETGRATAKEGELATAISQETARATGAEGGLDTRLTEVEGKIPSQASSANQLADKSFVNSSIATETAHYIYKTNAQGEKLPFDSVAELEAYSGEVTNNDYAFVAGKDSEGNSYFDRYKATDSQGTITWAKEYRLNNSSFTAVQWAAINSGLSGTDKAALDAALAFIETFGNIVSHNVAEFATASQGAKADTALQPSALTPYRTSAEQDEIDNAIKGRVSTIEGKEAGWDGKQDAISDLATIRANASAGKTASDNLGGHTVAKDVPADAKFTDTVYDDTAIKGRVSAIENKEGGWDAKYDKPSTGIPRTDLATDVKESLDKADTALQQHQSLTEYRKASQQDTIDAQKASKTELQSEEQTRAQGDTALATRMDNLGLSVVNGMLCITYNV